jgi:hypothetical protein
MNRHNDINFSTLNLHPFIQDRSASQIETENEEGAPLCATNCSQWLLLLVRDCLCVSQHAGHCSGAPWATRFPHEIPRLSLTSTSYALIKLTCFEMWLFSPIDTCELVFLVIFIAEMLFKMFGLGFHTYFASAFNCFDFTVVLCGLVEMIIQEVQGISLGISVLRSLRLLRIFKVTRYEVKWSNRPIVS